jgi:hypothetical protein
MKGGGMVLTLSAMVFLLSFLLIRRQCDLHEARSLHRRDVDLVRQKYEREAMAAGVAEYQLDPDFNRILVWKTNRAESVK